MTFEQLVTRLDAANAGPDLPADLAELRPLVQQVIADLRSVQAGSFAALQAQLGVLLAKGSIKPSHLPLNDLQLAGFFTRAGIVDFEFEAVVARLQRDGWL